MDLKTLTYVTWIISVSLVVWLLLWVVTGHWLTAAVGVGAGYAVLLLSKRLLMSLFRRRFRRVYGWFSRQGSRYPPNWDRLRRRVYRRDSYTCQNCGATGVRIEAHHIVPIRFGGTHHLSNLISLCSDCHGKADRKRLRSG